LGQKKAAEFAYLYIEGGIFPNIGLDNFQFGKKSTPEGFFEQSWLRMGFFLEIRRQCSVIHTTNKLVHMGKHLFEKRLERDQFCTGLKL
jgi:hypothetical protein